MSQPDGINALVADGRATDAVVDLFDAMDEHGLPAPAQGTTLPSDALMRLRDGTR